MLKRLPDIDGLEVKASCIGRSRDSVFGVVLDLSEDPTYELEHSAWLKKRLS